MQKKLLLCLGLAWAFAGTPPVYAQVRDQGRPAPYPPPRSPPDDRARGAGAIVGTYSGQAGDTTANRTANVSMEITQDYYGQDLAITLRLFGGSTGTATLRARVGPDGGLQASGQMRAGSRTFLMNLAGQTGGDQIVGGYELVPSGNTRVSGSEWQFRVRKFVPFRDLAPGRDLPPGRY